MSDYRIDLLPLDAPTEQQDAWNLAVSLGFLDGDLSPEQLSRLREWQRQDAPRRRYASREHRAELGELDRPVATFMSFDNTINTGGGHLEAANFITDVTVRQTERRRGLLRRLMMADLTEARDRGQTLAALTVSEATIYSRFGFGVATFCAEIELDISRGFAFVEAARAQAERGQVVQLDPSSDQTAEVWRHTFDQFHRSHLGSHGATARHGDFSLGRFDWDSGKPDQKMRAVAHLGEDGTVDGVLSYTIKDNEELQIRDLIALSGSAELALWAFIGDHDLLTKAVWRRHNVESPLRWALIDPRRLVVKNLRDGLWTRVLDVPGALRARRFEADGEIVLGVHDATDLTTGATRLVVRDGVAEAEPTTTSPDVELTADSLAGIYLGGTPARTLVEAGRVSGTSEAVATLDRLFSVAVAPRSLRYF